MRKSRAAVGTDMFKHILITALFVLAAGAAALRAQDTSFPQRPIRISHKQRPVVAIHKVFFVSHLLCHAVSDKA